MDDTSRVSECVLGCKDNNTTGAVCVCACVCVCVFVLGCTTHITNTLVVSLMNDFPAHLNRIIYGVNTHSQRASLVLLQFGLLHTK